MKKIFLLVTGLLLVNCTSTDSMPLVSSATYTNNVHAVYSEATFSGGLPTNIIKYWKNGLSTNITDGSYSLPKPDMVIDNNDVYIAADVASSRAGYFKNGIATQLSNLPSNTSGIAVSGNDVYVSGAELVNARCWKNGTSLTLNLDISTNDSEAYGVFVAGTDVYVVGQERGSTSKAKLWKNGIGTNLASGIPSDNCQARSVVVIGTDVYVAGTSNNQATYWKNGVATVLNSTGFSNGYSIYVNGIDVYVTGTINNAAATPTYWKNGIAINNSSYKNINSIVKFGNDLYLAGQNTSSKASFEQNGIETIISNVSNSSISKLIVN